MGMTSLDLLPNDCLHLIFQRFIEKFSAFFALALVSQPLFAVSKDEFCQAAVFVYITRHKDLQTVLKYASFYGNAAPFHKLFRRFARNELTHFLSIYKKPLSAKIIVATDLLRRYPRLPVSEQALITKALKRSKILPGYFESALESLRSPAR